MNFQNLFFQIHYCNYRKFDGAGRYSRKTVRTLPHHELIFVMGKGGVTIEKKQHQVNGGMLLYIRLNVLHSINYGVSLKVESVIRYMHQNINRQVTLTAR